MNLSKLPEANPKFTKNPTNFENIQEEKFVEQIMDLLQQ